MNWCILIPLLVGLICAILGYLLGKLLRGGSQTDATDLNVYKSRISKLEVDLEACRTSKKTSLSEGKSSGVGNSTAGTNMASGFAATSASAAAIVFNADAAKAAFGKKIKENDLTVVEGIGPKIKELFHNHDITTWKDLSNCTVEKCQAVLLSGGDRYKIHKPGTWPKQAKFAASGEWDALKKWQDELDGGK